MTTFPDIMFPHRDLMVLSGTSVAPMCWVMAPASLLTTAVPRILSRSEVLPWSTCPMTHTIGVLRFFVSVAVAIKAPAAAYS